MGSAGSQLIVVLFAAAVFLGTAIGPPGLMDDVDAVQAQIARNMLESGDWVSAQLNGVKYLEKSPLKYWLMAVSYAVFGVHDWAARLPLALSVVLLCWVTMRFGAWAFSPRAGFWAGLVLATSIGLFLFTRILIPDAMLTLTVTVALAACVVWPSAESVWRFDRLLVERDSRLVAGDWALAHIPPGSTIYQAGAIYGQLQLESSRPFKYRYWVWDEGSFRVSRRPFRWTNDWPDWIVVQESPLPYAHVSPTVAAKLRHDYALEYALRVVDLNEPRNVYDVQDAFFLPFAGFEKVRRPGPNILIYRRRS